MLSRCLLSRTGIIIMALSFISMMLEFGVFQLLGIIFTYVVVLLIVALFVCWISSGSRPETNKPSEAVSNRTTLIERGLQNQINQLPYTCPRCGAEMKNRTGKYGKFLGCVKYPYCRGTLNI